MNILLDYVFPVTAITPTPAASTAFLKQVLVVGKPKDGGVTTAVIHTLTAASQAATYFGAQASAEVGALFSAGMSKVYVIAMNDLNLSSALEGHESDFFTVLATSDFSDGDFDSEGDGAVSAAITVGDLTFTAAPGADGNDLSIELLDEVDDAGEEAVRLSGDKITILMKNGESTAQQIKDAFDDSVAIRELGVTCEIADGEEASAQSAAAEDDFEGGVNAIGGVFDLGDFSGVVGVSSDDDEFLADQAAIANRCAFHVKTANGAKNLFYSFGKMLSNSINWRNQQYISMPVADDVDSLGAANALFDDRISFVISDDEFSNRLALFVCGGKAIAAPYISKNLQVDIQSKAVQYISGNQPAYTKTEAALLEDELKKVIDSYIARKWIDAGEIEVKLEQDNFVASGYINIAEPKALWRIFGEMRQTL